MAAQGQPQVKKQGMEMITDSAAIGKILNRVLAIEEAIKDIREHMLTRADLHPSNRSRAEGELSDFNQQEAEERLKEMEAVMAGEDDCHLAKMRRGEAEAPIGDGER